MNKYLSMGCLTLQLHCVMASRGSCSCKPWWGCGVHGSHTV